MDLTTARNILPARVQGCGKRRRCRGVGLRPQHERSTPGCPAHVHPPGPSSCPLPMCRPTPSPHPSHSPGCTTMRRSSRAPSSSGGLSYTPSTLVCTARGLDRRRGQAVRARGSTRGCWHQLWGHVHQAANLQVKMIKHPSYNESSSTVWSHGQVDTRGTAGAGVGTKAFVLRTTDYRYATH